MVILRGSRLSKSGQPLAMPLHPGLCMRTSCSAGQSAGLDLFAYGIIQAMAGMYYRNWESEEGVVSEK